MMMACGIAALFISAAAGYWVITLADKEKGNMKKMGQLLGLVIVVASVLMASCKVYCMVSGKYCPMGGYGMMGKSGMCPVTAKPMGSGQ